MWNHCLRVPLFLNTSHWAQNRGFLLMWSNCFNLLMMLNNEAMMLMLIIFSQSIFSPLSLCTIFTLNLNNLKYVFMSPRRKDCECRKWCYKERKYEVVSLIAHPGETSSTIEYKLFTSHFHGVIKWRRIEFNIWS